ncbi:MAG: lyase, partial [Anaerolineae bacterium]|nr:lyase [Anaerolineae bacterium]
MTRSRRLSLMTGILIALAALFTSVAAAQAQAPDAITEFPVPPGTHPHDVAPAPDGTVWYTGQRSGEMG